MDEEDRQAREDRARQGDDHRGGGGGLIWIGLAALAMIGLIVWALL